MGERVTGFGAHQDHPIEQLKNVTEAQTEGGHFQVNHSHVSPVQNPQPA